MILTLEISGMQVINMQPEDNQKVYAITEAWVKLLEHLGITDYLIFKTFKSEANASHKWKAGTDYMQTAKAGEQYDGLF